MLIVDFAATTFAKEKEAKHKFIWPAQLEVGELYVKNSLIKHFRRGQFL